MSQEGFCADLRDRALDTYNSPSYGYHPGGLQECSGDRAGYVMYYEIQFPNQNPEVWVSDNVFMCDAAFSSGNNLGATLGHEAYHQVSHDMNDQAGQSWGEACSGS